MMSNLIYSAVNSLAYGSAKKRSNDLKWNTTGYLMGRQQAQFAHQSLLISNSLAGQRSTDGPKHVKSGLESSGLAVKRFSSQASLQHNEGGYGCNLGQNEGHGVGMSHRGTLHFDQHPMRDLQSKHTSR